jgi:hypothetical protein
MNERHGRVMTTDEYYEGQRMQDECPVPCMRSRAESPRLPESIARCGGIVREDVFPGSVFAPRLYTDFHNPGSPNTLFDVASPPPSSREHILDKVARMAARDFSTPRALHSSQSQK